MRTYHTRARCGITALARELINIVILVTEEPPEAPPPPPPPPKYATATNGTRQIMAEKAFRSCYKDLMKGITDPNDVAASLYAESLLTASERDQVMQANQTIDQKNQHLLRFLEARIAGDSEVFDKLVDILENEDAYTSLAKKLTAKKRDRKYRLCSYMYAADGKQTRGKWGGGGGGDGGGGGVHFFIALFFLHQFHYVLHYL